MGVVAGTYASGNGYAREPSRLTFGHVGEVPGREFYNAIDVAGHSEALHCIASWAITSETGWGTAIAGFVLGTQAICLAATAALHCQDKREIKGSFEFRVG
jgi:hypothetical protein